MRVDDVLYCLATGSSFLPSYTYLAVTLKAGAIWAKYWRFRFFQIRRDAGSSAILTDAISKASGSSSRRFGIWWKRIPNRTAKQWDCCQSISARNSACLIDRSSNNFSRNSGCPIAPSIKPDFQGFPKPLFLQWRPVCPEGPDCLQRVRGPQTSSLDERGVRKRPTSFRWLIYFDSLRVHGHTCAPSLDRPAKISASWSGTAGWFLVSRIGDETKRRCHEILYTELHDLNGLICGAYDISPACRADQVSHCQSR